MALARQALVVERAQLSRAVRRVQGISHHGIFDAPEERLGPGEVAVARPSQSVIAALAVRLRQSPYLKGERVSN